MLKLRAFVIVMTWVLLTAITSHAQDTRTAARELVKKWQAAIVNVRVVVKMRMSMAGREMQSSDDTIEAVGTVIDPGGLTVVSLGSINPGAMMTKLMGAGAAGGQGVDITSEPIDVKIRLSDGREVQATIALRDEDLNLAFIRPTTAPDKAFVAINLADGAQPAMLDEVVVLGRLGRVGGWVPAAALREIGGIVSKPRTFFVLSGETAGVGTPAFLPNGKIVGILTLRQIANDRPSAFAAMNGPEGLGLLSVVLPAADVLDIAKQATEKK
ncbi:MAG: serine protease [Acidobacteriota bacterium]|nr:serine protease [Acidobacteriota bacterium]